MAAAVTNVTCSNPECRVADTGKCVEGLALDKCPRYGRPLVSPAEAEQAPPRAEGIALGVGGRLELTDAPAILRARETRVIAVLGARDAGKTSLIASLYGLFQDAAVAGWSFAGSSTFLAFEVASHDARAASRRPMPHFERTARGPVGFYQLALRGPLSDSVTNLLLADRAGEEYLEVTDDASAAKSFAELRRADVITLLVDGHRLLDLTARHNLRSELVMILQALQDGGALDSGQGLAIALTKLDEIERSSEKQRAEKDFVELVEKVRTLFGGTFAAIELFRLAASPESDVLPRGHGVGELLDFWMRPGPAGTITMPKRLVPARAFGRLAPLARRS